MLCCYLIANVQVFTHKVNTFARLAWTQGEQVSTYLSVLVVRSTACCGHAVNSCVVLCGVGKGQGSDCLMFSIPLYEWMCNIFSFLFLPPPPSFFFLFLFLLLHFLQAVVWGVHQPLAQQQQFISMGRGIWYMHTHMQCTLSSWLNISTSHPYLTFLPSSYSSFGWSCSLV